MKGSGFEVPTTVGGQWSGVAFSMGDAGDGGYGGAAHLRGC